MPRTATYTILIFAKRIISTDVVSPLLFPSAASQPEPLSQLLFDVLDTPELVCASRMLDRQRWGENVRRALRWSVRVEQELGVLSLMYVMEDVRCDASWRRLSHADLAKASHCVDLTLLSAAFSIHPSR